MLKINKYWLSRSIGFLLLISGLNSLVGNAQMANIDSLYANLEKTNELTLEHFDATLDIAHHYIYKNLDSAGIYIDQAYGDKTYLSSSSKLPDSYYRHYLLKSWVMHGNQYLDSAKYYLNLAEPIVEKYGTEGQKLEIRINKGALLSQSNDVGAGDYAAHLIAISDTSININHKKQWILGYNYLSNYLETKYNYKSALDSLLVVFRSNILDDVPDYSIGVTRGIASLAMKINNDSLALVYLNELYGSNHLQNYQRYDIELDRIQVYKNLDSLEIVREKLASLHKQEDLNNHHLTRLHACLASDYIRQGDFRNALNHLSNYDSIAQLTKNPNDLKYGQKLRLKYYMKIGNAQKAKSLIKELYNVQNNSLADSMELTKNLLTLNLKGKEKQLFQEFLTTSNQLKNKKEVELTKQNLIAFESEKKELYNTTLSQKLELLELKSHTDQRRQLFLLMLAVLAGCGLIILYKYLQSQKQLNAMLKSQNANLIFKTEELTSLNQKLSAHLAQSNQNEIVLNLKARDRLHKLKLRDIYYFKADNPGIRVYFKEGELWVDSTLKEIKEKLVNNTAIIQSHRSILINVDHLEWVNHATLMMKNGAELKVGRSYKKQIIDHIDEIST